MFSHGIERKQWHKMGLYDFLEERKVTLKAKKKDVRLIPKKTFFKDFPFELTPV